VGQDGTVLSYKHKQGGTTLDMLGDKSWDEIGKFFLKNHKRSNKLGQGTTVLFGERYYLTQTHYHYYYYYYYYYYFIEMYTISMCDKR